MSRSSLPPPLVLTALALTAGCSSPLQGGWSAYHAGNDVAALEKWMPHAKRGDAQAQYLVGSLHDHGRVLPENDVLAALWYKRAAEQGHAGAQNSLGLLLYNRRGVDSSRERAAAWFDLAAEQGFGPAQCNLGVMAMRGEATPRDQDRARSLFRSAVRQGDAHALSLLASVIEDADGATSSVTQVVEWSEPRAQRDAAPPKLRPSVMEVPGETVAIDDEVVLSWLHRSADQGIAASHTELGSRCEHGRGIARDEIAAYMHYVIGAALGDEAAAAHRDRIARTMMEGDLVRGEKRALDWHRHFAGPDRPLAQ